jgi:hypothetical protein
MINLCEEHNCPMIFTGKDYVCVFEFVDEIIGCRKVTAFRVGKNVSLILDSEIVLPLICPHCSGEEACIDIEKAKLYVGLYVIGLSFNEDFTAFSMFFGKEENGEPLEGAEVATKLESISKIVELK